MAEAAPPSFPNSAGTERPRTAIPENACDCHLHVYDVRDASDDDAGFVKAAAASDYRQLQRRLGLSRAVIVQPRIHGTHNAPIIRAIETLGRTHTRGIAVVDASITDAALKQLDAQGIRGVRFSLYSSKNLVVRADDMLPLAQRIADLGWHIQLHLSAVQIVDHADLLFRLPVRLVFDHMARLLMPDGTLHAAFDIVRRLVDERGAWVKLSGAYLDSRDGAAGPWADTDVLARRWVAAAPERLVWGSDWPHPTEAVHKPDDAQLLDLLARWVPDEGLRHRVLVDNPASLYGF